MLLPGLFVILLLACAVVAVSIYFGGSIMWWTFKGVAALNRLAPAPPVRPPKLQLVPELTVTPAEQAPAAVAKFAAFAPAPRLRRPAPEPSAWRAWSQKCGVALCQALNAPEARFCHRCGHTLDAADAGHAA